MGIPSVAILSRMIRLPVCRPGRGGKGIAPDPFVCWSAQHEPAALRGDLRRGQDDYDAHTARAGDAGQRDDEVTAATQNIQSGAAR